LTFANYIFWLLGFSVGLFAAHCALVRGAARVVLIDSVQYRLDFAKHKLHVVTINRKEKNVYKELRSIFPEGPDVAIEAVGFHYVEVSLCF
jgi:threonine dehydrogenase-like Zn-dependent dehydrogenase